MINCEDMKCKLKKEWNRLGFEMQESTFWFDVKTQNSTSINRYHLRFYKNDNNIELTMFASNNLIIDHELLSQINLMQAFVTLNY